MNHRELCEVGARFLKRPESANGHGCHFTIVEAACYGENPCRKCGLKLRYVSNSACVDCAKSRKKNVQAKSS